MINETRREMCAPQRNRRADLAEEAAELKSDLEALRAGDSTLVPPWMTLPETIQDCEDRLDRVEAQLSEA